MRCAHEVCNRCRVRSWKYSNMKFMFWIFQLGEELFLTMFQHYTNNFHCRQLIFLNNSRVMFLWKSAICKVCNSLQNCRCTERFCNAEWSTLIHVNTYTYVHSMFHHLLKSSKSFEIFSSKVTFKALVKFLRYLLPVSVEYYITFKSKCLT